jgi:hypothetical protein
MVAVRIGKRAQNGRGLLSQSESSGKSIKPHAPAPQQRSAIRMLIRMSYIEGCFVMTLLVCPNVFGSHLR